MCKTRITVEQIGSPIRRHHAQRETLIGLGLNRIGRIVELTNTPEKTRGMIAKVAHLVRVIHQTTELDCFVDAVRAVFHELTTTRIVRGDVLWAQFEEAVAACRADPKGDDRQITERVNELAVAKVLLDDKTITGPISYEPDFLPDGRKIDFVVDRGRDNLYVEVKTVQPMYSLERQIRKKRGINSYSAGNSTRRMLISLSRRSGWVVRSTETCSRHALIFSITLGSSKRALRQRRRLSPVLVFSCFAGRASHGTSPI